MSKLWKIDEEDQDVPLYYRTAARVYRERKHEKKPKFTLIDAAILAMKEHGVEHDQKNKVDRKRLGHALDWLRQQCNW